VTDAGVLGGADGSVSINEDGTISFDPGDGFQDLGVGETATVEVEYTISDGQGGTDTATATVTVEGTNDGPVAQDESVSATEDGGAVTGQLDATDVDGDDLTFSLVDGPAEGTVTVNEDGSFSFDPGDGFQDLGVGETQTVEFTYEVSDGQGGTSTATGTVTVEGTNDGPVAQDESVSATEDGGAVTGQLDATDVDGDDLTFSLVDGPAEGTVTVNEDGSFSFDPGDGFQDLGVGETQTVEFTYEVSDGQGGTSTATGTVTVEGTNDGPVASDESISATEDGGAVTGQLDATDVDGDDLTFSLVDGPAEGTVTVNEDGSFSFDPGDGFQDLGVGETQTVEFTYRGGRRPGRDQHGDRDGHGGRHQ
jgi:VCBS repeat-containing protein